MLAQVQLLMISQQQKAKQIDLDTRLKSDLLLLQFPYQSKEELQTNQQYSLLQLEKLIL